MTTTERLLQFVEYKGISKYEFHKKNGLSNGFLDKSRAIGTDKCARILENYPEINPEWLIMGEGDMLRTLSNSLSDFNVAVGFPPIKKDMFFLSYISKMYKENPEKYKQFEQDVSEYEKFAEELTSFKSSLQTIIDEIDLSGRGISFYENLKNGNKSFIEQVKKISEEVKTHRKQMKDILDNLDKEIDF